MAIPDTIAITNNLHVSSGIYYLGVLLLVIVAYIAWKIYKKVMIKKLIPVLEHSLLNQYWGSTGRRFGFKEFFIDTKNPEIDKLLLSVMLPSHKVYALATDILISLGKADRLPKDVIYEWGEQHLECVTQKTLLKIWEFCSSDEGTYPCVPKAVTLLGQHYLRGLGVKKDLDKAISLFKKASDLNEDAASLMLATLSGAGYCDTPDQCVRYLARINSKEYEVQVVIRKIIESTDRRATCLDILKNGQ